ncbi:MAG: hypothetical protein NTY15_04035 [Planctomycetota bacterium]|jgi:hypothetical protein|nr:hypothetical protein [Planctomycetota bacterium]
MNSNASSAQKNSSYAIGSENKWIWGPLGVFKLELIRTLTFGRIMTWLVMALFPPTLIGIASLQIGGQSSIGAAEMNLGYVIMLFFLIPQIVTVLGLLLWATPIVHAELEAQTWGYYVVRPGARRAVLLGKYAIAVLWAFSSTSVAVTFAIPFAALTNPLQTWAVLCFLNLISALAYGALFTTLGTLIQKRAMVSAFMYGIIVEGILSTLPAAINQFTVSFRLRSILQQMLEMDLKVAPNMARFFDTSTSISFHLVCLGLFTAVLMCISLWRVEASQFAWQSEV